MGASTFAAPDRAEAMTIGPFRCAANRSNTTRIAADRGLSEEPLIDGTGIQFSRSVADDLILP
jgi:hypothetical protein